MELLTARFKFRGLRSTDRAAWIAGLEASQTLHQPWVPIPPPGLTLPARFAAQLAAHEAGTSYKGVAIAPDGRIAAWANLNDIVRSASWSANAGWSVHAAFAGKGVMTEVVMALLDVAFTPLPHGLGLHRVAAGIMPENAASLRVAEKAGFRREGYAVELVHIAGAWRDHVLFAKLAREHRAPVETT